MEVQIHDEIWLVEQWFERSDGWEHCEIVVTEKAFAEESEKDGWTVTHYKREAA